MNAEALLARARESGPGEDFGDPAFREGLERLVDALEREARLSELGRVRLEWALLQGLRNRLAISAALAEHPEIREVELPRPLVIVGFPRTGTTLLQRMLASDPRARSLALWELLEPAPPPESRDADPRVASAMLLSPGPELRAIHDYAPDEADECNWLLRNTFRTPFFSHLAHVPSYLGWVLDQDPRPAYAEYATQLRILTWRCRGAYLVLKAPLHLWALDALLEALPDARIVHLHRDPRTALASYASLARQVRRLGSDDVDPEQIADLVAHRFVETGRRAVAARQRLPEDRFLDLSYDALLADPLGSLRRVWAHAGVERDPAAEHAVQTWLAAHPQHAHGVHRYELGALASRLPWVEAQLGPYRDRFGAP